jgi:hypothetical protein
MIRQLLPRQEIDPREQIYVLEARVNKEPVGSKERRELEATLRKLKDIYIINHGIPYANEPDFRFQFNGVGA